MYKKIMVPLDGSKLAECVFPHLTTIVKGCETPAVVLVRVAEPAAWLFGTGTDGARVYTEEQAAQDRQRLAKLEAADAQKYLAMVASQLKLGDAAIQTSVLEGKASEALADYSSKNGFDLIVMSTHGRSGVSRWLLGSVADRLMRSSLVPVLMVRAPGCEPKT